MATQTLTLRRGAPVHWHSPDGKRLPAVIVRIVDLDLLDTMIELLRTGAGYCKGDTLTVSAQRLTPRQRTRP